MYPKHGDEALTIEELRVGIRELNRLAKFAKSITLIVGNHEERYQRILSAVDPRMINGLVGLSLREQLRMQGLDERVRWFEESPATPSLELAQWAIRHGHKQAGRFGGGVNVAANRLNKSCGKSELIGHHHAGQQVARAAHGNIVQAIANPCMQRQQRYTGGDATWILGFTIIDVFPGWQWSTPHMIVMSRHGAFAYGGKMYGAAAARRVAKREDNQRTQARSKKRPGKSRRAKAGQRRGRSR